MEPLKELVIKEATNLKERATKDELSNLDFKKLDPDDGRRCIYGQMTGNCYSNRASILLNQCTTPFTNWLYKIEPPRVSEFGFGDRDRMEYSAIEYYILLPHAKSNVLIGFLKGELDKLTPEML